MGGLCERERWTEERCKKAAGTQGGKELRGRQMRKRKENVRGDGGNKSREVWGRRERRLNRAGIERNTSVRNRQGLY